MPAAVAAAPVEETPTASSSSTSGEEFAAEELPSKTAVTPKPKSNTVGQREAEAAALSLQLVQLLEASNLENLSGVEEAQTQQVDELVAKLEEIGKLQPPPLKQEQVFGNYSVAYTSTGAGQRGAPAGGRFRGKLGRRIFKTRGLYQNVVKPKEVANLICFALIGLIKGAEPQRGQLQVRTKEGGLNACVARVTRHLTNSSTYG